MFAKIFILLIIAFFNFTNASESATINAYQDAYAMNFEIWKPSGLPAGWYATFDGFPVAQISENRWVYGKYNNFGVIAPTDILVGSVVPERVPGLVRIASTWINLTGFNEKEFIKIQKYNCNRIGWYDDGRISTPIAWNVYSRGVYLWNGKKWQYFSQMGGEYASEMLNRVSPRVSKSLIKNGVNYNSAEPVELAEYAREWGILWLGRIVPARDITGVYGADGDSKSINNETSGSSSSGTTVENENSNSKGNNDNSTEGQWDY